MSASTSESSQGSQESEEGKAEAPAPAATSDPEIAGLIETLRLDANQVDARLKLADALAAAGDLDAAIRHADLAIVVDPACVAAYARLGEWLDRAELFDQAVVCYHKLRELDPQHPALANLEATEDRLDARGGAPLPGRWQLSFHRDLPIERRVVPRRPIVPDLGDAMAYFRHGHALLANRQLVTAAEAFRRALHLRPDLVDAQFMLASITAAPPPATTPAHIVMSLFDEYAERFDNHLVNILQYKSPERLWQFAARHMPDTPIDIADLGCGTGLVGVQCRSRARRLVGIDLSAGMLDKARRRGIYDELLHSDAVAALRTVSAAYDLIIAADVLIYIGDPDPLFAAAATALRPGGLIAITAETSDGPPLQLAFTKRYRHSVPALRDCAVAHGLREVAVQDETLRLENGNPVIGFMYLARRAE